VRVALEGGTPALLKILHGLETAPTLLFADNLEIRTRGGGRVRRNKINRAAPTEDLLMIRFDLAGYIAGTEP
jgi:hypothetical protein